MDARILRLAVLVFGTWLCAGSIAVAAQWKTQNFVVTAPTEEFAKEVAFTAEQWRARLAKEWLGKELPNWYRPCPISVKVGQIGAGGATTFNFDRGQVFGWRMNVQGTRERILDSVIPHEVSHTVFASHFRRPLPRWADEGAATLAEHEVEQRRQDLHLKQVWNSHKIPLKTLLSMTEYPSDMRDVMTLYAQGYSLADYLVQKGGKPRYLKFLDLAEQEGWDVALRKLYKIEGVDVLERTWGGWVLAGSPDLNGDTLLAENDSRSTRDEEGVIRAQTPDAEPAAMTPSQPAPAVAPSAVRTAALGDDVIEFLPPQRPSEASPAPATRSSGKEPRPAPLGSYFKQEGSSKSRGASSGAVETSGREPSGGDRSLPRTSRVEPVAKAAEFDFFNAPRNERVNPQRRILGSTDFPSPAVF